MSNRRADGERVNKWGGHAGVSVGKEGPAYQGQELVRRGGGQLSTQHEDGRKINAQLSKQKAGKNQWGNSLNSGATVTDAEGVVRSKGKRPSHRPAATHICILCMFTDSKFGSCPTCECHMLTPITELNASNPHKRAVEFLGRGNNFREDSSGTVKGGHARDICAKANPGNKIQESYTAEQVAKLLQEEADMLCLKVGGGLMGSKLAHENEAPFPEKLPEFFIKSFCRPDGVVCDPFCGSGTTMAAAIKNGRKFVGIDARASQVELSGRRIGEAKSVTVSHFPLFGESA